MKMESRLASLAALLALLGPLTASAETYNFIFDNASRPLDVAKPSTSETTLSASAQLSPTTSNFDRSRRWGVSSSAFYGLRDSTSAGGVVVAANYAVTEWLRAQAFAGGSALSAQDKSSIFGGAEAQLLPLHLPLGASHRVIDLGVSLGFSNFHKISENPGTLHLGPAISARLGSRLSLVSSVRANLGAVMADAGVAFRL